jgi:hypothetical protein
MALGCLVHQGIPRLRGSDGARVCTFISFGSDNKEFYQPFGGIAIDRDGRIVVADTRSHRVQVLE